MKILITNNTHEHYDRVGEIIARQDRGWTVSLQRGDETVLTYVEEKDFKPTPDIIHQAA